MPPSESPAPIPSRAALRARPRAVSTTALALLACALAGAAPADAASPPEPASLVRYFGDASSATGAAVARGSCDVNGDDHADVVVGAWFWDKSGIADNTGAAYVLLGGPQIAGGDLSNPEAAGAVRIEGPPVANEFLGFSVGCGGDVNGDGYDDILIGDYISEQMYVVFGALEFTSIDLGNLGSHGFRVRLDDIGAGWNFGFAVTGVGDMNGDQLDDFAVAAVVADTLGRTNNGRVYILPGKQDVADVVLPTGDGEPTTPPLMVLDGSSSEERLGQISIAGDADGDDVPDFVVGSYTATPHGPSVAVPGAAWVISGTARGAIDLATPGDLGFAIWGPERGRDRLGQSVASAGDQNGDGYDDVVIGGDGVFNAATGRRTGSAWVVYGGANVFTALDVVHTDTAPDAQYAVYSEEPGEQSEDEPTRVPRGYWIDGVVTHTGTTPESLGYSVDGIGDVNGDGTPDLLLGAYGYRTGDPSAPVNTGAVWVVYGRGGSDTLLLGDATPADGYRIDGLASGDRFGRQVAHVGDVDGNGVPDFAVGADFARRPRGDPSPRNQAGEVTIALLHDPPGLPEVSDVTVEQSGDAKLDVVCPDMLFECVGDLELIAGGAYQLRRTFSLTSGESASFEFDLTDALLAQLVQTGRANGTVRLRGTGVADAELDEERPVVLSLAGWVNFGLPRVQTTLVTVNGVGKARFGLACPASYAKCKGEAVLRLGGESTAPVRFSLRGGESGVAKLALSDKVLGKLSRGDRLLVGSLRLRGVIGGADTTSKTTVVVKAAP